MLLKLLSAADTERFEVEVVSLTDAGDVGPRIEALGVRVRSLGMRRGVPNPGYLLKLALWMRRSQPAVVHTWMYHANLIGGLAALLSREGRVVWSIHNSHLDRGDSKMTTRWTSRVCAFLSHVLPTRIVCCSQNAAALHARLGYAASRMTIIPNGIDITAFRPDQSARPSVRRELGLSEDSVLIGLVARFDPQKDHRTFIQAARTLSVRHPQVHFVLCGEDIDWKNLELTRWIREADIGSRCHLLGRRDDVPRITAALDIATLSSYGEAFPMVIGEALSCSVPCVVTDVGDSAHIVGAAGLVVRPRDGLALSNAWSHMLSIGSRGRQELGDIGRRRVRDLFALDSVAARYEAMYLAVASELQMAACK